MTPAYHRAFAWLTAGVLAALLVPFFALDGLFMDGMLYSCVALNMARGFGTLWEPRFSQMEFAGQSAFHEHPPLVFGLQSLWFKVFGEAFWVEHLYALVCTLIIAWLILRIWKQVVPPDHPSRQAGWLAVLFWIVVPPVHWCLRNNMIENTMAVFTLLAVLLSLIAAAHPYATLRWSFLAGLSVAAASLCKGLPGLFPLSAPLLLSFKNEAFKPGKAIQATVVMGLALVSVYGVLLLFPAPRDFFDHYVNDRLLGRIGHQPVVEHHWAVFDHLFNAMLLPLVLSVLVVLLARRKQPSGTTALNANALRLAFIGLCGVLPLGLTLVQKSFYMSAALPFLSIACALLAAPSLNTLLQARVGRWQTVVRWSGICLIVASFVAAVVVHGKPSRNDELLHDVHLIRENVPRGTLVAIDTALWNDWDLQTSLMRYGAISVQEHDTSGRWFLCAAESTPPAGSGFNREQLPLQRYSLWRRP